MRLTIITVNFNNREGLRRTARSVAAQTFNDFEWLVIDGGSTDGSQDVLAQYASRITWFVSEPDGGIYEAMNKGLARANGEFVQFLNSGDSFIEPTVLENVFCNQILFDVNYGDQWCLSGDKVVEKRSYPDEMDLGYLFRNPLGHQASFIRTSIAKNHPYRVKYSISADRAFFLELYLSGASFHHIDLPIVLFDTEGIGSRKETKEQRKDQLQQIKAELLTARVVEDIERLIDKSGDIDFVMRVVPLRWIYMFFRWLQRVR